jgi:hypothetical protein
MKKSIFGLALAAASACASASGYQRIVTSVEYDGVLSYGVAGGTPQSVVVAEKGSTSVSGPIRTVTDAAYQLRAPLQKALIDMVASSAASQGITYNNDGAMTGTITASVSGLTGAQAGYNQLAFGGANFYASFSRSFSTAGGAISGSCTASLSLQNIQFSVVYSPATGQVNTDATPVIPLTYTPASSTHCSTSFDWVPFLGSFADRYIAGKVNAAVLADLNAFSQQSLSTVVPSLNLPGLTTGIERGKYVIGGVDWGAYIADNVASLFTGKSFTITLGEWSPPPLTRDGGPDSYGSTLLSLDLSDGSRHLTFSGTLTDNYTYRCPPGCTPW